MNEEEMRLKNEWFPDAYKINKEDRSDFITYLLELSGDKKGVSEINNNKRVEFENNLINQKDEYYKKIENERRIKIKKGIITDAIIDKQEVTSKKHLIKKLIRYNYNLKYLESYYHLINLEYLVRLKEFLKMKDGEYLNKDINYINRYEDIINDFIDLIDEEYIKEYEKTKYSPENLFYPLTMSEYVKPKKKEKE